MSHLPAERLAALADHSHCPDLAPTAAERAHLDLCLACTREVNAYARLAEAASRERERDVEPLAPWAGIAAALRADGLIADDARTDLRVMNGGEPRLARGESATSIETHRPAPLRWATRAAAALAFAAIGVAAGRATAGGSRAGTTTVPTRSDSMIAAGRAIGATTMRAASYAVDTAARFVSTAEALTALTSAERQYERAAAFLVENDSSAHPADSSQLYRARLAALDNVMAATREALYDAPHDPLINRYYLATMGAREATLRQLGTSLPQGERISRY